VAGCAGVAEGERYAVADEALATSGQDLTGSGPCAAVDQAAADCPVDIEWRNHGQYVSCVAKYFAARVHAGDIGEDDRAALVEMAAQSDVGMPAQALVRRPAPDFAGHFAESC
jgi:hypothetical protein